MLICTPPPVVSSQPMGNSRGRRHEILPPGAGTPRYATDSYPPASTKRRDDLRSFRIFFLIFKIRVTCAEVSLVYVLSSIRDRMSINTSRLLPVNFYTIIPVQRYNTQFVNERAVDKLLIESPAFVPVTKQAQHYDMQALDVVAYTQHA